MGRKRRMTNEFCFESQQPVQSLYRHYMRKHGGEPQLRMPSPPTTFRTSCGDVQSPSPKRQRKDSAVCEASRPPKQHCCYWPTTGPSKWRRTLPKTDSWNRRLNRHRGRSTEPELHLAAHQATQADGCPWSFGRVRRQVLQNVPCLTVVEPPPGARDKRLSNSEREFATRLAAKEQRQLCNL